MASPQPNAPCVRCLGRIPPLPATAAATRCRRQAANNSARIPIGSSRCRAQPSVLAQAQSQALGRQQQCQPPTGCPPPNARERPADSAGPPAKHNPPAQQRGQGVAGEHPRSSTARPDHRVVRNQRADLLRRLRFCAPAPWPPTQRTAAPAPAAIISQRCGGSRFKHRPIPLARKGKNTSAGNCRADQRHVTKGQLRPAGRTGRAAANPAQTSTVPPAIAR